jgi:hypothetical protein
MAVEAVLVGDERRHSIRFHYNGKQSPAWVGEGLGVWEYLGDELGWIQESPWPFGTKFGPWELVDKHLLQEIKP